MTFPDPLLTKADVAELLRCCERTIERQVREGAFPPPQRFGKESLWFQSVIHMWLDKRREAQKRWVDSAIGPAAVAPAAAAAGGDVSGAKRRLVEPQPPAVVRSSRTKPRPANVRPASVFSVHQLGQMQQGG